MDSERWVKLPFNENIEISDAGRLRNVTTGAVRKIGRNRQGYPCTVIYSPETKKSRNYTIHRLVAYAFIPPIAGKTHVNHRDFDKTNNKVDNLEWCTRDENIAHYFKYKFIGKVSNDDVLYIRKNIETLGATKLSKELGVDYLHVLSIANGSNRGYIHKEYIRAKKPSLPKPINKFSPDGTFIKSYRSIKSAAKDLNTRLSRIQDVLSGNRKSHRGFIFKYHQCSLNKECGQAAKVNEKKNGRKVVCMDKNENILAEFKTKTQMAAHLGMNIRTISRVINGEQKTAKGLFVRYAQ